MELFDRANAIAQYVKSRVSDIPDTAVVLGSGLGAFGDSIQRTAEIDYNDIKGFPAVTVAGHKGKMIFGYAGGKYIIAMQGRFHRYEGYDMQDVTLYVRVLALLGVKNLLLTNAAGAVNTSYKPGDLMIIEDQIALFCDSPLFGKNDERFGPRFPSMSYAYAPEYVELAEECAARCGIKMQKGVYCYCKGPMYETPAEIRAVRALGADAVGMSTVAETTVAVHCGIKVLGISCMTNMAAGILKQPLTHAEVMETGKAVETKFKTLVTEICKNI